MNTTTLVKRSEAGIKPVTLAEIFYGLYFFISSLAKCLYFQFITDINTRPFFSPTNVGMAAASFGAILTATALVILLSNRHRNLIFLIVDICLTILLTADTLYFRYYYNAISVPVMLQVKFLGSVNGSVKSLLNMKDIIYILDLPFILIGFFLLKKAGRTEISRPRKIAVASALVLAGLILFGSSYLTAPPSVFYYSNNYIIKTLGVFYFHIYDTGRFIKENVFESKGLSSSEKNAINGFFGTRSHTGEKYQGMAKGKNLVVVQVEALQQFVIGAKVNGEEITPNLNNLLKDSLYFNNFYYQVSGGNTADAEFLCNTSLYPVEEGAAYFRYPINDYDSLPKALKKQGYKVYAAHADTPSFWNREEAYKGIGFDTFINTKDFVMDEMAGWNGHTLSDASFFRQSLEKIDTSQPFYSFLITLSSHHPFDYFTKDNTLNVKGYRGTLLGDYMLAAHFVDGCIGKLIQDLKTRGLYDNTLLVIYGDHYAIPEAQSDDLLKFEGLDNNELQLKKLQKVPCIIHCPGIEKGETIGTTGGEIDLMPTIANLMGFDAPHAIGKDLLNTAKGYVMLKNGSLATDKYIYIGNSEKAYDINTGALLEKKDYEEELKSLQKELYISDLIIQKDAFRKLK